MTIRSPIFRKLLLGAMLSILVTVGVLDFYLTRLTARQQIDHIKAQLWTEAGILAGELGAIPPAALESWAKEAQARAQARVTIIHPNGKVAADSEHDPETMENHAGRPEVMDAMRGRPGASIRHSATVGHDLCYAALPLTYAGQRGWVIRLAVPMRQLDEAVIAVRSRIIGASVIACALALLVAYAFSRWFTDRIRQVQQFSRDLLSARHEASAVPDWDDELGELARTLAKMASELRETFEKLSVESARREAILSSMVEGVLAVDRELRVIFCNQSLARAVGARYPVPERLPLLDLIRDPGLLNMLTRALVTGSPGKQRLQLASAPGRVFEAQAAPLVPSRRGAVAILHDITELERLERVRKDFVANVSHELRTPLAAIRGYAETLLDGAIDDRENNRRFLEIIHSHAGRLNNIASDLLVLSELESGKPAPALVPVQVAGALETAIDAVQPEAEERGVALNSPVSGDIYVLGDRIRLEQALVNLLNNAVKFNRPGGSVSVSVEPPRDGTVRIRVADTGIGIPSEDLPRIFERFYRVDKARSREVGGTGLGLSIVKHVIEKMNGTVTVESELGKGSVFTICLPAATPPTCD